MMLRRQLAQLDPDTVLHGGVVQVDLKPVPHDDSATRESKDVLHWASRVAVSSEVLRAGAVKAAPSGRCQHAHPVRATRNRPGPGLPGPHRPVGDSSRLMCGPGCADRYRAARAYPPFAGLFLAFLRGCSIIASGPGNTRLV